MNLPFKTRLPNSIRSPHLLMGAILLAWAGIIICLSSVPPVSRDALTHHLYVPRLFIDHGGMVELPSIVFSYYPMNLDLLYLIALWFGNDIIPKYIHFAFALLTAGMLFSYLRRRLGFAYAFFGVCFFLSLPLTVKLSVSVYVDLGLVFFSTAAILQLLNWMEERYPTWRLVAAGVFYGLALGTKYNGLIGFILLAGAIPFLLKGAAFRKPASVEPEVSHGVTSPIAAVLIFCGVALVVFSPWMIRNMNLTGNPLYPLFNSLFNPQPVAKSGGLTPFLVRRLVYKETFWQIILVPLRIFFSGQDDNPQLFDGRLSPFLLLLPLVSLFALRGDSPRMRRQKLFLLYFSALTILIVFFKNDMRVRYIAPAVPPLVILSAMGLHHLSTLCGRRIGPHRRIAGWATGVAACGVLLFNLPYLNALWADIAPLSYLQGEVSREAYIEKHRPEYALYRYANSHLGDEVKVLGLFLGNRGYYSKRQIVFDIPGFKDNLETADTASGVREKLHHEGVTHLMINERLFSHWAQNNLSPEAQMRLAAFLKNETQSIIRTDMDFWLLAVKPDAS
jgi:hypothetical protein